MGQLKRTAFKGKRRLTQAAGSVDVGADRLPVCLSVVVGVAFVFGERAVTAVAFLLTAQ